MEKDVGWKKGTGGPQGTRKAQAQLREGNSLVFAVFVQPKTFPSIALSCPAANCRKNNFWDPLPDIFLC